MDDSKVGDQTPSVAELEPDMQAVRMKGIDQSYYSVNYHMLPTEVVERLVAFQVRTPRGLRGSYQVNDSTLLGLTMARIQMLDESSDKRIELEGLVDFINQAHDVIQFAEYLRLFGQSKGNFLELIPKPDNELLNDPKSVRKLIDDHYPDGFSPTDITRMVESIYTISKGDIPKAIQVTDQFNALVNGMTTAIPSVIEHVARLVEREQTILSVVYRSQLARLNNLSLGTLGLEDDITAISESMAFFERGKDQGEA